MIDVCYMQLGFRRVHCQWLFISLFSFGYDLTQEEEDVTKKMGGGKERHFSYYAYAGLTGTRRWSHKSEVRMTFHPYHDGLSHLL